MLDIRRTLFLQIKSEKGIRCSQSTFPSRIVHAKRQKLPQVAELSALIFFLQPRLWRWSSFPEGPQGA